MTVDRYQYLLVMAACLAVTLPLELFLGARVYRRPRRLVLTVVTVGLPFALWDAVAIARGHWWFSDRYTTGWRAPGSIPVEELVFFVVIPICALLTYEVVDRRLGRRGPVSGNRTAGAGRPDAGAESRPPAQVRAGGGHG